MTEPLLTARQVAEQLGVSSGAPLRRCSRAADDPDPLRAAPAPHSAPLEPHVANDADLRRRADDTERTDDA